MFKLFQPPSSMGLVWHIIIAAVSRLLGSPSRSWSSYVGTLYMLLLYLTFSIPIIAIPSGVSLPLVSLVFSPAICVSFGFRSSFVCASRHSVSFFQVDPICLILSFVDLSQSKSSNLGREPYLGCFLWVGSDLTFCIISCLLSLLVTSQIGHC